MKKTIEMSLETAREWYVLAKENKISGKTNPAIRFLEENFTIEELEGKKGYTWEESFLGDGYSIAQMSPPGIVREYSRPRSIYYRSVFRTEKQALSALAFAQLSHIVAKYNAGPVQGYSTAIFVIRPNRDGKLEVAATTYADSYFLKFLNKEDAATSLEVNHQLWKQYWMM